jgi:hypothetical protein
MEEWCSMTNTDEIIEHIRINNIFTHKDIETFCIKCLSDIKEVPFSIDETDRCLYYFKLFLNGLSKMMVDQIDDNKIVDAYIAAIVLRDIFSHISPGELDEPIFHVVMACRHIEKHKEFIGGSKDEEGYYFNVIKNAILYHHADEIFKSIELNPFHMIIHYADVLTYLNGGENA